MARDHNHKSEHPHGSSKYGSAFVIGISLNLAFVIVETVYGPVTLYGAGCRSGHNLIDVLGLALS